MKNRPGMKVADFSIELNDGTKTSLCYLVKNDTTLIAFYEPDCYQFKSISEKQVASSKRFPHRILFIDVTGDYNRWKTVRQILPGTWEESFSTTPLSDKEMYFLCTPPFLSDSPRL